MSERSTSLEQGMFASGTQPTMPSIVPIPRSTRVEQLLLLASIVILPLQDHIPTVAGMSVSFLIFAALGAYIIVNRPRTLSEIWCHPVFIVAYVFVGVSALLEFSSPLSRYDEIVRFGQMVLGAVCVAVLCRDRAALTAGLYGYMAAALWVAVVLYLTTYGVLQGRGGAEDFHEASKVRAEAFADRPLQANLNAMAVVCTQGAVVAFALSMLGGLKQRRMLLAGLATFCLVAAFLPMSRGAAVNCLVCFAIILYAYGIKQAKTLLFVSALAMAVYALVPDAVWSRMAFSTEVREGRMEGRAYLLTMAINHLPEYIVSGVGVGNYYNKWGFEKGFTRGGVRKHVLGTHNSLLQIAICWGSLGLLIFLWILWCIYRSIPLRCGRDELSLALLGIIVSLGILLLQSHNFYDKAFALGIGMLVGARQWVWPSGVVVSAKSIEVRKEAVR